MKQIYFNGDILTMVGGEPQYTEAILVEDGTIVKTGSLAELKAFAGEDVKNVDLAGKCLMPAFIDGHSHFVSSGQMAMCADLSNTNSFEEIVLELNRYLDNNGRDTVTAIMGFGYDHNFLAEHCHPDKHLLDQVSRDIPIVLLHVSMHLGCANSKAIELAGISTDSPNPPGGVIGRVDGSNEPNGYFEEAAMYPLHIMMGRYNQAAPEQVMMKMQENYLKNGITTVQEGSCTVREMQMLASMGQLNALKLDVVAYPLLGEDGFTAEYPQMWNGYHQHVRFGGYKMILDGSPQARSAWMSEPYEGSDDCGYPAKTDEEVVANCMKAISEGKQILAHCNGDAASQQFIDSYKRALEISSGNMNLRPIMIHCQTVRDDQLEEMAKMKMMASSFVGHVYYWGDIHLMNFGTVRGNHISPVRTMLDNGVKVSFHQDTPVTAPNMLHTIWCAVNRISRMGKTVGADQAISVYEALQAATIGGAFGYFEEDRKGTIEAGKKADLVVLDRNPLKVNSMEIKDIQVMQTIKDGVAVYCK